MRDGVVPVALSSGGLLQGDPEFAMGPFGCTGFESHHVPHAVQHAKLPAE